MKKFVIILFAALFLLSSCAPYRPPEVPAPKPETRTEEQRAFANGEWSAVKSLYKETEYNAVNFFVSLSGAVADGVFDDSSAIQAALDKAAAAGGGKVYIAKGKYRVSRPINIPDNVSLIGDFVSPTSKKGVSEGTVIIVEGSDMLHDASLFILHDNSVLSDLTVWYEGQTFEDLSKYAYTVRHATGKNAAVKNIAVLNAYNGITADSVDCEHFTVENIYMTAINNALRVLNCREKLTVSGFSVSPVYWINDEMTVKPDNFDIEALNNEIYSNLSAVTLSCPCDMSLTDITVDTAKVGLSIDIPEESDKAPLISLLNISNTLTPVSIGRLPDCGAAFALCTFGTSNLLNSTAVKIGTAFDSAVVFNSCTFPGQPTYSVKSEGSGRLSFVNCKFVGWRNAALNVSDIIFTSANSSFNAGKDPVLLSDKSVGILASCYLSAAPSSADPELFVISTENEYDFDVIEKKYVGSSASVPEIRDRVFYAKDYGLSESNIDNYNAIQSAVNYAYVNGGGTVFVPAGQYRLSNEVRVKEGVRIMGVGSGTDPITSTIFITEKNAGDKSAYFTLEDSTEICGVTFYYYRMPDFTAEEAPSGTAVFAENRKDIYLHDICLVRPAYGISLTSCSSATMKNIYGTTLVNGIKLDECADVYADNISFSKEFATSDEIVSYLQSHYSGAYVSGGESIVFRNISTENADYVIDIEAPEVLIVPVDPVFCALNVFSRDVYATVAVGRYPYASVINAVSRPKVFSTNAYHITTFYGNRGKVNVYNLLGAGDVTAGVFLRSGDVSVQSSVFCSLGKSAVYTDGANVSVIGSLLLDNNCTYHVEASSGGAFLLGNITNNLTTAFDGTNIKYIRRYVDGDASYADDGNMRGILPETE
ncbi:MAG: hypothetical protein II149_03270 [Clostridia bacterium]|nr:hypothetical protein [Clostridia bacterium]